MFVFKRAVAWQLQKKKGKKAAQDVLDQLNAYLNAAEAEPVYWLCRLWGDQQKAVTYKALRESILAGQADEKMVADWQAAYANFVKERLQPIWTEAMLAGAERFEAKHPGLVFDPFAEGVQKWTQAHGAQWVTNVTNEAREAMAAMIDRATTGAWTVDELSRAMRPLIGLTKPQAAANLNYYEHVKARLLEQHPNMKTQTAEKRAHEAALKYAARQQRQRAHTIATTELAYSHNKGADEGMRQAMDQGIVGNLRRVWVTAADEAVCRHCGALDGVSVGMDEPFQYHGHALDVPPAHPRCHCAVAYEETGPPEIEKPPAREEEIPRWEGAPQKAEPPEPPLASVPGKLAVPEGMADHGKIDLGGTGELRRYTDTAGREWLFKPAQSKNGAPEAFRAYAQEAGYRVQAVVDPETAIPVGTGELGGRFGAFQRRVESVETGGKSSGLKWCQEDGARFPEALAPQMQREHVTDWLLGNFDSHGGNFIMDEKGRLYGIDKEQAFKYLSDADAQKMSVSYHPNAEFGETEPVYNTLFRRFAKGELDLDLQNPLPYIKRVEAIPDSEYREIFRDYAEALRGKGKAAEELLDQIVERKGALRETYREFYSDLLTARTGKKQAFVWADEAAPAKRPLAAARMAPEALKKMAVPQLKQLAKQQKIPYYNKFKKSELINALTDPVKAAEISAKTKAKLLELEATRPGRLSALPKPTAPARELLRAGDVFRDLLAVPVRHVGMPVASDRGMVEGLNLTARRMRIGGEEVYELSGKLAGSAWRETLDRLKEMGAEAGTLGFEQADDALALFLDTPISVGITLKSRKIQDGGALFELFDPSENDYRAWQGFFRLRLPVTSDGAGDARRAKALLERLGLEAVAETPEADVEHLLKEMRLVWQHAPAHVPELDGLTGGELRDKLKGILKEEGINPKRAARMKLRKAFDGYATLIEEGIAGEYEKAGLRYVWTGVGSPESIVKILQSPGLMSTNTRCRAGMRMVGASPEQDMRTGGSDNVFTRIGVKTSEPEKYSDCFNGGPYRILIDPKEMERTDWYAYDEDNFGTSEDDSLRSRDKPLDFIRAMAESYSYNNEIMFRHGIPKEHFTGILAGDDYYRTKLLNALREAGIGEINGKPIEDFVKVGNTI